MVLKADARGVRAQDLIKWCKERLAPYKAPQYIEFRDMLPKSKVGKLLRREMRDEERRKAALSDSASFSHGKDLPPDFFSCIKCHLSLK